MRHLACPSLALLACGCGPGFAWEEGANAAPRATPAVVSLTRVESPPRAGYDDVGFVAELLDRGGAWSSSTLRASWRSVPGATHYLVQADDLDGGPDFVQRASAVGTSVTFSGLEAATAYQLSMWACKDAACATYAAAAPVLLTTAEEVWRLQGSGASYAGCATIADRSNSSPYAFRYGDDAPAALRGKVRLYYKTSGTPGAGDRNDVGVGLTSGPATSDPDSVDRFEVDPRYGVGMPGGGHVRLHDVRTFQAVPLASGGVRLYMEVVDAGNVGRLVSFESRDGSVGADFDPSADTRLDAADLRGTPPSMVLGVSGDAEAATRMKGVRQFKIGWPTLERWAWDQRAGTFMVLGGTDTCGATQDGLFLAHYDGRAWAIDEAGACARVLVPDAHGPVLVHLGGVRYKLYYEDQAKGRQKKPLRVLYADGTRTGDPAVVEFEDWDRPADAREVHFRWPDGTLMDADAESGLGDHVVLSPTLRLEDQVMYMNLGGFDNGTSPGPSKGIGMAVLANP